MSGIGWQSIASAVQGSYLNFQESLNLTRSTIIFVDSGIVSLKMQHTKGFFSE